MRKLIETVLTMLVAARYVFRFCWRNGRYETVGRIVVSVCTITASYLSVLMIGHVVNAVQTALPLKKEASDTLSWVTGSGLGASALGLIGLLLFSVILGRFNWYFGSRWRHRLRFANQRELNNHRATLDIARFRSKEYDDLSKRIRELPNSWQTRTMFADEMFNLFTTGISFALFGIALLWHEPLYAVVLVITALPMAIIEFKSVNLWWVLFQEMVPAHKRRDMLEASYQRPNAFVQALMFNQMPALRREIDINVGGVLNAYNALRKKLVRNELLTHTLATIGLCGVLAHALWSTVVSAGEIGTLTVIIAAARTFQGDIEGIVSMVADQWNSAKGVLLIEEDFLGLKPVVRTPYPVIPKLDIAPRITVDQVSFSYPDSKMKVLDGVSFTIEPRTKVAIVGKSGHGKSTIQALLMRHYDPTEGSVFADEINLRNIEPSEWSNVVSALTQEYTVLERRIAEEIASSRLDQPINHEQVMASAEFANFSEVVRSDPDGYESQIGVEFGGRDFSGGERQRLALARVHYRGTPILILDEPDAKLDPESAQKVVDRMFALRDTTVVVITHHVSRAERCDKIIVIEKGRVAEEGTHEDLMRRGELYAAMYAKDKKRLGAKS